MKIFISWAGGQSQHIARGLRIFLPRVIQELDPWMSEEDIPAGERGINDIESQLESANFGILCLTAGNLGAERLGVSGVGKYDLENERGSL